MEYKVTAWTFSGMSIVDSAVPRYRANYLVRYNFDERFFAQKWKTINTRMKKLTVQRKSRYLPNVDQVIESLFNKLILDVG